MSRRSNKSRRRRRTQRANSGKERQELSTSQSQHMARVNLSQDEWRSFRSVAVIKDISIADYLGHLVAKELRRIRKREGKRTSARERAPKSREARPDEQQPTLPPPYETEGRDELERGIPAWGG